MVLNCSRFLDAGLGGEVCVALNCSKVLGAGLWGTICIALIDSWFLGAGLVPAGVEAIWVLVNCV